MIQKESLSDQENKKLLVSILQLLMHPVISEIFSYIISYVEHVALSIIHITKRGCRISKKTKNGFFYEKYNLLQKSYPSLQLSTLTMNLQKIILRWKTVRKKGSSKMESGNLVKHHEYKKQHLQQVCLWVCKPISKAKMKIDGYL